MKNIFWRSVFSNTSFNDSCRIKKKGGQRDISLFAMLLIAVLGVSLIFGIVAFSTDLVAYAEDDVASVTYDGITTYYSNIATAMTYANGLTTTEDSRAIVTLLDNVASLTAPLGITAGNFITLDLNSFTLSRGRTSAAAAGHVIDSRGDFILTDTSLAQTGVVTGGYSSANGGGICVIDSTFTMEGGAIKNNKSNSYGGGIYTQDAIVYIKGGVISGNTASNDGGGIEVYNNTVCVVTGGNINNNSANSYGGGINLYDTTVSVIIAGGMITNNRGGSQGGGIWVVANSNLTVCGSPIIKNNVRGGSITNGIVTGGSVDNVYTGSTLMDVGCSDGEYPNNFTGEMGIYSNNSAINTVFGTALEDVVITGEITNDQNIELWGVGQGTNCLWNKLDVVRIKETGVCYSSIANAYSAITSGQTMELLMNAKMISASTWTKSFTLTSEEGKRWTISPANVYQAAIFQFISQNVLTIKNIIFDGGRYENSIPTGSSCTFYLKDNATLNIEDGTIIQNFHITTSGVAVFIDTGTLNMSGGEIKNNYIKSTTGIIYGSKANVEVNITGGIIKDNKIFTNASTGAVHMGNASAKLNIGGTAKIYDNYYKATPDSPTQEAKDIYLPSGYYLNQTSNFSGLAYVYSVNAYTENAKFGNNPSEYTGAKNFVNSREDSLVGRASTTNLVWGNAVELEREEKRAEILSLYDEDDYSTLNWLAIENIIDTALEELLTVEDVKNFAIDSLELEIGEIPTWTQSDLTNAREEIRGVLEQYYQDKHSDMFGVTIPEGMEDAIDYAMSLITSKNYDDDEEINSIILIGKIAIEKEVKYAELDDLLAEYNEKLYNATNWTILEGYIISAKDTIEGYTDLQTVENFNIDAVRINCDKVETSMIARIGDDYYETLTAAVADVSEGGTATIYIIKSFSAGPANTSTFFLEIDGNRNITLKSDLATVPQGKTAHIMKREKNGTIFHIKSGSFLTIADIEMDGNNYQTATAGNFSHSVFYVGAEGTLTIEEGTKIYKFGSQCGYTVASVHSTGTFIMNGGSIYDNKNNTAIPGVDGSGYFYFNGGEISDNQGGSSYGAANVQNSALINLAGNMTINMNKTNTARNLHIGNRYINVTDLFTGYVSVYSNNYTEGAIFGTVADGAIITGTILNARNTKLVGVNKGGDLIWDFEYDPTKTQVTTKPTVFSEGVVTRWTVDNVAKPSTIPPLSEEYYYISYDISSAENPKIIYTLKDTFLGNIVIDYDLEIFLEDYYKTLADKEEVPEEFSDIISAAINEIIEGNTDVFEIINGIIVDTKTSIVETIKGEMLNEYSEYLAETEDRSHLLYTPDNWLLANSVIDAAIAEFDSLETLEEKEEFDVDGILASAKALKNKVLYFTHTYGKSGNTGAYDSPLDTFTRALGKVANNETALIILLGEDVTCSSTVTIPTTKYITFISSDTDIEVSYPTTIFVYKRASVSSTFDMLTVSANSTLTLENVSLSGNRTPTTTYAGSIVNVSGGTLTINKNTTLEYGGRQQGGGAVYIKSNSTFIMNDGEIKNNYNNNTQKGYESAIGTNGSNISLYFLGGKVYDNTATDVAISSEDYSALFVFGGSFELFDNTDYGLKYGVNSNELLEFRIREDFQGILVIDDIRSGDLRGAIVEAILVDMDNVPIDMDGDPLETTIITDFPTINPASNKALYLRYDGSNWIWDYYYEDYYEVFILPTYNSTGILGRPAIIDGVASDTVYKIDDAIEIPLLDLVNYSFKNLDSENGVVNYTFYDDVTEIEYDIIISVDWEDSGFYYETLTEPTFVDTGVLEQKNAKYPGAVFADAIVPILSSEDYAVVFDDTDENDRKVIYTLIDNEIYNMTPVIVTRENFDTEIILPLQDDLEVALLEYIENIVGDTSHLEDIIETLVNGVDETNYDNPNLIADSIASLLSEAKDLKKTEIENAILAAYELTDYSEDSKNAILAIIEDIELAIDALISIEAVETFTISDEIYSSLDDIPTLLDDAKNQARETLETYYKTQSNSENIPDNVADIIDGAIDLITQENFNNSEVMEGIIADAKTPILKIVKHDKLAEYNEYLGSLEDRSHLLYIPGNWSTANSDILASLTELDALDTFEDIEAFDVEAIIADLEALKNKVLYFNTTDGSSGGDGSFGDPLDTFASAIAKVGAGQTALIIQLGEDTFASGNVTIDNDKNILFISSDIDIEESYPTNSYTYQRANSTSTFDMITIASGASLVLENITLDGNRTSESNVAGSIVKINGGELIINEAGILTKGNNSNGGGAICIATNSTLIMNGGEITENYGDFAAIGFLSEATDASLSFLGGKIYDNDSPIGVIEITDKHSYTFGGEFELYNNTPTNFLYTDFSNINIREDFIGTLKVDDERYTSESNELQGEIVPLTLVDIDGNVVTTPTNVIDLPGINPIDNDELYLHYNGTNWVWEFFTYEDYYAVFLLPTYNSTGILGKPAIINGEASTKFYNRIDPIEIPVLSLDDYIFENLDLENGVVNYTYKHETLGDFAIAIIVDWQDDGFYYNTVTEPTFTSTGILKEINIKYPGAIFDEFVAPKLSLEDYDVTFDKDIEENKIVIYTLKDNSIYNMQPVEGTWEDFETYVINPLKTTLRTDLLEYIENLEGDTTHLEDIIETLVNGVDETNYDDPALITDSIASLLSQAKELKKTEIEGAIKASYIEDDYSIESWNAILAIIASLEGEIEALTSIEAVEAFTISNEVYLGLDDISTLFDDKKAEVREDLENYYKALANSQDIPDDILQIIVTAIDEITENNYDDDEIVNGIVEDAKKTIGKIVKNEQLSEYSEYLTSLENRSHLLYTPTNWGTANLGILAALTNLDALDTFVDIEAFDVEAIIADLEALKNKVLYFNTTDGSSGGDGSFDDPLDSFASAIAKVGSGETALIIQLGEDVTNVGANVTIDNDKNILFISSDTDIEESYPTNSYIYQRANSSSTFDMITIASGASLVLENITLDGNRTSESNVAGSIVKIDGGELIINEDTTLTKGSSSNGGGGIYIAANSTLIMNAGEITKNYNNNGKAAAIGVADGGNISVNFLGGKIYDNQSTGVVVDSYSTISYVFGGDFELYDNENATANIEYKENQKIREDFSGILSFNDNRDPLIGAEVELILVDMNGDLIEEPNMTEFLNIYPIENKDLHLHYNGTNWSWDYDYEDHYQVFVLPTLTKTGLMSKAAIINGEASSTIYNPDDTIEIPMLNADDYKFEFFDEENDLLYYTYVYKGGEDEEDYEVKIKIDWSAEDSYYAMAIQPTFTSTGKLEKRCENFPGAVFDEVIIPQLSSADYDVIFNNEDENNRTVTYTLKDNPYNIDVIEVSREDFDYYVIDPIKTQLSAALYEYMGDVGEAEHLEGVILDLVDGVGEDNYDNPDLIENSKASLLSQAKEIKKDAISAALFQEYKEGDYIEDNWTDILGVVEDILLEIEGLTSVISVERYQISLENQELLDSIVSILDVQKLDAQLELEGYIEEGDSERVLGILTDAIGDIQIAISKEELDTIVENTKLAIDNQRELETEIIEAKSELDDYLLGLIDPTDTVKEIISAAKETLDEAEDIATIEGVLAAAKADADAQYLLDQKTDAKSELGDYLLGLVDPSDVVKGIISAAQDAIDEAEDIASIEGIVVSAKDDAYQQLVDDKVDGARTELEEYLSGLDNPSEEVRGIISAANAELDKVKNLEDIPGIVSEAIDSADEQHLADKIALAKIELEDYLLELPITREEITVIISSAKDALDLVDYIDFIGDIVFNAKEDARTKADEIIAQEIIDLKGVVERELEEYYQDELGEIFWEAIADDIIDIISNVLGQINGNNYNDASAIADLLQAGKEDIYARCLEQAKGVKLAELDSAIDALTLAEGDYSGDNWLAIQTITDTAKGGINSHDDIDDVLAFDINTIINVILSIETLEATRARELQEAKTALLVELDSAIDALTLVEGDYSGDNWLAIQTITDLAKGVINSYDDIDDVLAFDINTIINDILSIETLEATRVRELQEAKDALLAELDSAIDALTLAEGDYSGDNWLAIQTITDTAKGDINSYDDIDDVLAFDINTIISDILSIETLEATRARELQEAKTALLAEMDSYINDSDNKYYTEENWQVIQGIINGEKSTVEGYENIEAVLDYDIEAFKAAIDAIETKEGDAEELASAKVEKKGELNDYVTTEDSDSVYAILDSALADIDAAISPRDINIIVTTAKKEIDNQRVKEAILVAKGTIREYLEDYIKDVESPNSHLTSIIDDIVNTLNEDNYLDLEPLKADSCATLLVAEKEYAKGLLTDYEDGLSGEEITAEVLGLLNVARTTIENEEDIEDVRSQAFVAILESDKVIAKLDLDAAKEHAKEVLQDYVDGKFAGLLDGFADQYIDLIENATSIEEVAALLDESVGTIEGLEGIANLGEELYGTEGETLEEYYKDLVANALNDVVDINKEDTLLDGLNSVLDEYKEDIKSDLDNFIASLDEPSDAVKLIINVAKSEIENVSPTGSDIKKTIDDILSGAKDAGDAQQAIDFEALYKQFKDKYTKYSTEDTYQYNEKELTLLRDIFDEIEDKKTNKSLTKKNLEDAIVELDMVKTKSTSSDIRPGKDDDISLGSDEAYGILESDAILDKGTKLIVEVKVEMLEVEIVKTQIDSEKLTHKFGILGSAELKEEMQDQEIYGLLDIYLVDAFGNPIAAPSDETFTIRILIPEELRNRTGLRVVYIAEDTLEVFDIVREGNWLIFETDHLSNFYLIGDPLLIGPELEFLNLWWIIIIEIVLILGLAFVIWWKLARKDKKTKLNSFIALPLLVVLVPQNAYIFIGILSFILLILGAFLAYILLRKKKEEANNLKNNISPNPEVNPSSNLKGDISPNLKSNISSNLKGNISPNLEGEIALNPEGDISINLEIDE